MSPRRRQWLAAAAVFLFVLAATVGWAGYLNARNTPRWQQTAPGAWTDPLPEGGMPMRLASLTTAPVLVTDRGDQVAPAGAVWVIAVIDYRPPSEGSHCMLVLLAQDGRRWNAVSPLDYSGERGIASGCGAKSEQEPRGEQIYLIPEDAAGSLAGLVAVVNAYRGTTPHPVLTPAQ